MRKIDMVGRSFGSLRVIEQSGAYRSDLKWRCVCTCGKETIVRGHYLGLPE